MVAEGDQVAAGQELARLDDETAAGLERDVAQAEVDLQDSRDALEDAMAPPTTLERVEAEAAVATAELVLQEAEQGARRHQRALHAGGDRRRRAPTWRWPRRAWSGPRPT